MDESNLNTEIMGWTPLTGVESISTNFVCLKGNTFSNLLKLVTHKLTTEPMAPTDHNLI